MGNAQSANSSSLPRVTSETFSCTTDWLETALNVPKGSIKEIRASPIRGGVSGPRLHRLNIHWEGNTDYPSSMVSKSLYAAEMPPRELFERCGRDWTHEKMCRKEVGFYKDLQPILEKARVNTPKCYYIFHEDDGDCCLLTAIVADARTNTKMLLLIEDLGGYQHYKLGDQLPHEDALIVVKTIARMHATFWNNPVKGKKDDELLANMYDILMPSDIRKYFAQWILGKNFAENVMKQWEDSKFGREAKEIPDFQENLQYLGDSFEELVKPFLTMTQLNGSELFQNITFLHGDLHPGNMCITKDHSMILYDWQCYGYGHNTTELSHFMSPGARFDPEKDKELLQAYYEELTGDFGQGVLVDKESYPYCIFEREMLIRFLTYATTFTALLAFQTPASLDAVKAKKESEGVKMNFDAMYINMFRRVFHILRTPERDIKAFILSGK